MTITPELAEQAHALHSRCFVADAHYDLLNLLARKRIDEGRTHVVRDDYLKRWRDGGLDLIVIDYLQMMRASDFHPYSENRQYEVSRISRGLKALARELNVPVLALSQLSRSVETRQSKRPMLSDLRESGSLEQDADIVMFLYRDDSYIDTEVESACLTELIVAKHRNGPTGAIDLYFEDGCTKFIELDAV